MLLTNILNDKILSYRLLLLSQNQTDVDALITKCHGVSNELRKNQCCKTYSLNPRMRSKNSIKKYFYKTLIYIQKMSEILIIQIWVFSKFQPNDYFNFNNILNRDLEKNVSSLIKMMVICMTTITFNINNL